MRIQGRHGLCPDVASRNGVLSDAETLVKHHSGWVITQTRYSIFGIKNNA